MTAYIFLGGACGAIIIVGNGYTYTYTYRNLIKLITNKFLGLVWFGLLGFMEDQPL